METNYIQESVISYCLAIINDYNYLNGLTEKSRKIQIYLGKQLTLLLNKKTAERVSGDDTWPKRVRPNPRPS